MDSVAERETEAKASSVDEDYFETLYGGGEDPWGFRTRWYEARKRALLLACLPEAHFESIYEPACATGELAAELAPRCNRLLASDFHLRAVELARVNLQRFPNVTVDNRRLPGDWPEERFDLIVLGEIGYFLSEDDLTSVIDKAWGSLNLTGWLIACHWRHAFEHCSMVGDEVHDLISAQVGIVPNRSYIEVDFRIDLWQCAASREGHID